MAKVQTPKLAVPFRMTPKGAVVVEQDSTEEIEQCAEAVLRTPLGYRIENPEFGLRDQTFNENGADLGEIAQTLSQWGHPLTDVEIERDPDLFDRIVDNVRVHVRRNPDG